MFGTYSISSTNPQENSLGGALQIRSTMPCDPKQLIQQQQNSQTSTGRSIDKIVFDRESGKTLVVQYPSFDLMMSGSYLSFKTDLYRLSETRLIALLKCLLILQSMPEIALGEAAERLEGIAEFYSNRSPQANLPAISASTIKGKLRSVQIRPPIVLES